MLWILLSLPFLVWAWWGITFTILIYVVEKTKEAEMQIENTTGRARIIRYTTLEEASMPGLLSFYQSDKNIIHIDRDEADRLPEFLRNRLEMSTETFTRIADHGATLTVVPYNQTEQTPA